MKFFVTSFSRWHAVNQDEDPYTYGNPDPDRGVPALVIQDLEEEVVDEHLLFLYEETGDVLDDNPATHPDSVEALARALREDYAMRISRLEREKSFSPRAFTLMGMSLAACDRQIKRLTSTQHAPSELARLRYELREQALALAPHNRFPIGRSTTRRG